MTVSIQEVLTISIATKDRVNVLEETLRRIEEFGLGECELIVCDDGSTPPLQVSLLGRFPHGRWIRNDTPMGQAIARNQIASAASRPFILQLDDDSYPVAGSVEQLIAAAHERDGWLAMALPLEEPVRGRRARLPKEPLTALRGFVGCAALINRAVFLQLGGYADWIGGMVEEDELSLRGFASGYQVYANGALQIRHDVTPTARNVCGIEYRSFRNWTTTWLRHAPMPDVIGRALRLCGAAVWIVLSTGRVAPLAGTTAALANWRKALSGRQPMRRAKYVAFMRLPHALNVLSQNKVTCPP
jgi:GT2 family glycosyltransferase